MSQKHFIVCSHGFGVAKDDRGLFPDAVASIADAEIIMFNYGIVDEHQKTVIVTPFSHQVKTLEGVLSETRGKHPDAIIDLVCHSQGCITAALLAPKNIRRTIMLSPPYRLDVQGTIDRFKQNPQTLIDMNGVSHLVRADGTTTIVPKEFWEEARDKHPVELYNIFSEITDLFIVNANQDNVLGAEDSTGLSRKIKNANMDGDHGFKGDARMGLKLFIQNILKK